MTVTDKTETDLEDDQTGDGTDDPKDAADDDVADDTGDGSDDDTTDDGDTSDDAGADEEEDDDPPFPLPYTMDGVERTFDYRIVQREDGKYDLDDETKSRLTGVLPLHTFQSKYDRSQAELKESQGRVEAADVSRRKVDQAHAELKQRVEPYTHHLAILREPGAREHFEKVFSKQLKAEGYDPSTGFDPHSAREEQIVHRENRVKWETETKPLIEQVQREALKTVNPDISDEEVEKVMSFVGQNTSTLQPQIIPDSSIGYPRFAFANDTDANVEMRRLAEVPMTARDIMIGRGLIESVQLKGLKEDNKNLSDKFDRATRKAKVKATGGSGAGSKGGKKKQSPEPILDPEEFTTQWFKDNPDKVKDL